MTSRLFVALELPHDVIDQITTMRDQVCGCEGRVRWEKKEKLHITLKFLGDTDDKLLPEIINELDELVQNFSTVELTFSGFGLFYRDGKPKILWAGFHENNFLAKIAGEINKRMEKFGFDIEKRKFKSHVTLLRLKGSENLEQIVKLTESNFPKINFKTRVISLYKSELKPAGSVYTRIKNFELK